MLKFKDLSWFLNFKIASFCANIENKYIFRAKCDKKRIPFKVLTLLRGFLQVKSHGQAEIFRG